MRFLYGFIAIMLWMTFTVWAEFNVSNDALYLALAIVAAGAMAGGGYEG